MAILNQKAQLTLTPTARLSRRLAQQQAIAAEAAGTQAWLPPQIYSFTAWLAALRHEYFLIANDARTPIDAQQALQLWQNPVDDDVFLGTSRVAELAQQAWRLIHEHALDEPTQWPDLLMSEDNASFKNWAKIYRQTCTQQELVDEWAFAAELPKHIANGLLSIPEVIHLSGFELTLTPLQQHILEAFENAGSKLEHVNNHTDSPTPALPIVQQYPTASSELIGAANWARQCLEAQPEQSIAIVVPDLNGRVDQVDRTLRQVFDPSGFTLHGNNPEPWHISLGKPLAQWPLVHDALSILELNNNRFSQPQIHQLLRSPFLPGWAEELSVRQQVLVRLAQRAPYYLTGQELLRALNSTDTDLEDESLLSQHISAWRITRRDFQDSAAPSQWAGRFQQELSSIGFGQGRPLNSREYQVLQRWHDLLEDFSRLDLVSRVTMSREGALKAIQERAANVVFRERNTGVPIEILGVAEALGSEFDALWITTLDSNTWPGSLGRQPLVPGSVQTSVPRATSEGCLAVARAELQGLLASAPLIEASFARGSEEIAMEVAGLLGPLEVIEIPEESPPVAAPMETISDDSQAPALLATKVSGGTGVLRDQSACPFRAFAQRRLGAVDASPPRPGLDAAQRGTVVHLALEYFWVGINGATALEAMNADAVTEKISEAVAQALTKFTREYLLTLNASAQALEQQRIERVIQRWLEIELKRGDFEVLAHEHELPLQIGELQLKGKIDRIDRLADGSTLLIDYKTGNPARGTWAPDPRIEDPQLPAYALAMDPQPSAIAFARLKPDSLSFEGLAEQDTDTRGITTLEKARGKFSELFEWSDLLDAWQNDLQALANDFKAGKAAVDPRDAKACKYCHLHSLCRVNERAPFLTDSLEDDAQANGDE